MKASERAKVIDRMSSRILAGMIHKNEEYAKEIARRWLSF